MKIAVRQSSAVADPFVVTHQHVERAVVTGEMPRVLVAASRLQSDISVLFTGESSYRLTCDVAFSKGATYH
jgi:hypothetical protein